MSGVETLALARTLARMAASNGILAPAARGSGYAVFTDGDRRRRPYGRLSQDQVRALLADGAVELGADDAYRLTRAGRMRALRATAEADHFAAQHEEMLNRFVVDSDGDIRVARGFDPAGPLTRLARSRNADGSAYFSLAEMDAARRLFDDWTRGRIGLVSGSDWSAPPRGAAPRGPGAGREGALAAGLDARARADAALNRLAAPLRRMLEAALLEDRGIAEIEVKHALPARSAKLVLKLALAQLAEAYRAASASA